MLPPYTARTLDPLPDLGYANLLRVEGGAFDMGGDDPEAFAWEKPVHRVQLDTFYLGQYPVTQAFWKAVMGEENNPSNFKGDRRPVESVSWSDAREFIKKLNGRTAESRLALGLGAYRLPTEAEWEYAARGGAHPEGYIYAGSDKLKEVGWYEENSNSQTQDVGLLLANELGFYDLSGNVYEWCADWYGGSEYYEACRKKGLVMNPQGPAAGASRVVRGGCWFYVSQYCRVAYRNVLAPGFRRADFGFRLALSPGSVAKSP